MKVFLSIKKLYYSGRILYIVIENKKEECWVRSVKQLFQLPLETQDEGLPV